MKDRTVSKYTNMKKILSLMLLMIATISLQAANVDGAKIQLDEKEYNFGKVNEYGGPVSHTFTFTNVGNKPLVITKAFASCGCTTPEYSTKPIKPGEKGKIKVTFNPLGRPGPIDKLVRILSNDRSTVLIEIHGEVYRPAKK